MSERFFDNLARTLASPMPRRRALRVAGAALVTAAVPGIRPRTARAAGELSVDTPCSGSGGVFCGYAVNDGFNYGCCGNPAVPFVCCNQNEKVGSWCCREGYTCGPGDGKGRKPNCICDGDECGAKCCPKHQECEGGKCVPCTSEHKCGKVCCKKPNFCGAPAQSLCCEEGADLCAVLPKPGSGLKTGKKRCCPQGTTCCANDKRTDCCGPGQKCKRGACTCPEGKKCGADCCTKDKPFCADGMCCPKKGEVNCGGECCGNDCCGDVCCAKGENCAASIAYAAPKVCCTGNRLVVANSGRAVCCPKGTVPDAGLSGCCPKGDPNCCSGGDLAQVCADNSVCVQGKCVRVVRGN